jgi:hypothetical protein
MLLQCLCQRFMITATCFQSTMLLEATTLLVLLQLTASWAAPDEQNCTDGRTCSRVDEGSSEDCKVMVNLSACLSSYTKRTFILPRSTTRSVLTTAAESTTAHSSCSTARTAGSGTAGSHRPLPSLSLVRPGRQDPQDLEAYRVNVGNPEREAPMG